MCVQQKNNNFHQPPKAKGLALRKCPMLFTRSFRIQTGNIFIFFNTFTLQRTYGKLSWSREVKRTTSLNQRHINKLVTEVCSLTITDASFNAVQKNKININVIVSPFTALVEDPPLWAGPTHISTSVTLVSRWDKKTTNIGLRVPSFWMRQKITFWRIKNCNFCLTSIQCTPNTVKHVLFSCD